MKSHYIGRRVLGLALLPLCLASLPGRADSDSQVPLSEVPEQVLAAVRNAHPGIEIESAARVQHASGAAYEIEGDADGTEFEYTVSPDGRIVETDRE